jgi:phosphoserine phosphatase/gas vesicle protein
MKSYLKFLLLTAVFIVIISGCESNKKKKESKEETIENIITDTIVIKDSTTKEIVKIVYDTVKIKITEPVAKPEKKTKPSLKTWNDKVKNSLESFVESITDKNSKSFIEPKDRFAVFDMEGTLWPEKPVYFQMEFIFDRIKDMYPEHPEWKKDKLINAALNKDLNKLKRFGAEGLFRLSTITQSGMTTEEYENIVKQWIDTAKCEQIGKLYKEMAYLPMTELIEYLKHHDFKVYLITEGGSGFVRPFMEEVFCIPQENVIASLRKLTYEKRNGKHVLIREPEIVFINNNENKVIAIAQVIGRKPVIAFGNSDTDNEMFEWISEREGKSLIGIIHHTDDIREWAYDEDSKIGKLDNTLKEAEKKNWLVVDMKNDWKEIYKK